MAADSASAASTPAGIAVWVEAARPRTLPAAIAPVMVGSAAAQTFIAWRCAAALIVALAVQVAVNYANDYFDGVRGVDSPDRVGPRRVVAAGLVAPRSMKVAIAAALGVAAVAGAALAAVAGWPLLVIGAAAFVAALAYSGGPRPYASAGLGEVFVFVFFGLVATVGSQYVHDEAVRAVAVVAAVPIGLLATAILVVNNLRDIETDQRAGKRTLASWLGDARTRQLFVGLVITAFAVAPAVAIAAASPWPVAALAAAPLGVAAARPVTSSATGRDLIPALSATGRLELGYAVLLAAGLVMS